MNLSPVTADSIAITCVYSILLLWGMWVGVRQVYQGFFRPQDLLNPLFGNRKAIEIFTFHLMVVTLDLWVCGPISLHHKSRLWYWGGRIALLSSSLPVASYFNRNPQSFGALIGHCALPQLLRDLAARARRVACAELVLLLRAALLAGGLPVSRCGPEARAAEAL